MILKVTLYHLTKRWKHSILYVLFIKPTVPSTYTKNNTDTPMNAQKFLWFMMKNSYLTVISTYFIMGYTP